MRIPNELCEEIVHHLSDRCDVYNILFVSPAFRREGQCAMLAHVDMTRRTNDTNRRRRLEKLLTFLSRNISLARAVRQLTYVSGIVADVLLDQTVPHMINLRSCIISDGDLEGFIHPSILRCPCKLSSFSFTTRGVNLPVTIVDFLKSQPTIVDLALEGSPHNDIFADSMLPHLTTLRHDHHSGYSPFKMFLANRPIVRLRVVWMNQFQNMDSEDVKHIRVLHSHTSGHLTFEKVEFLVVRQKVSSEISRGLLRFPALKVLSFAYPALAYQKVRGYFTPESIQEILSTLFDTCRSLHTIQVLIRAPKRSPPRMAVFNQALEIVGTKLCDWEEWKTFPLQD